MFKATGHFFLTEDGLVKHLRSAGWEEITDSLAFPNHSLSIERTYAIYAKEIGKHFAHGIAEVEKASGVPFPSGEGDRIEAHGTG